MKTWESVTKNPYDELGIPKDTKTPTLTHLKLVHEHVPEWGKGFDERDKDFFLRDVVSSCIRNEVSHQGYGVFYHGMSKGAMVFQDLYIGLYELQNKKKVGGFYALRVPGADYTGVGTAKDYYKQAFETEGKNDASPDVTKMLLSVNLSLFGNNHSEEGAESSWYLFRDGYNIRVAPSIKFIAELFFHFGYGDYFLKNERKIQKLLGNVGGEHGILFQIFVPDKIINDITYISGEYGYVRKDTMLKNGKMSNFDSVTETLKNYTNAEYYWDIDQLQARLYFTNDYLLNPDSGIKMFRFLKETSATNKVRKEIQKILDECSKIEPVAMNKRLGVKQLYEIEEQKKFMKKEYERLVKEHRATVDEYNEKMKIPLREWDIPFGYDSRESYRNRVLSGLERQIASGERWMKEYEAKLNLQNTIVKETKKTELETKEVLNRIDLGTYLEEKKKIDNDSVDKILIEQKKRFDTVKVEYLEKTKSIDSKLRSIQQNSTERRNEYDRYTSNSALLQDRQKLMIDRDQYLEKTKSTDSKLRSIQQRGVERWKDHGKLIDTLHAIDDLDAKLNKKLAEQKMQLMALMQERDEIMAKLTKKPQVVNQPLRNTDIYGDRQERIALERNNRLRQDSSVIDKKEALRVERERSFKLLTDKFYSLDKWENVKREHWNVESDFQLLEIDRVKTDIAKEELELKLFEANKNYILNDTTVNKLDSSLLKRNILQEATKRMNFMLLKDYDMEKWSGKPDVWDVENRVLRRRVRDRLSQLEESWNPMDEFH